MTTGVVRRVMGVLAVLAAVTVLVWAVSFRLHGGHWERVETPSMGTTAPVGSLLWVQPTDVDQLRVGEFISFHPPGRGDVSYSHRIHAINADGTLTTKGEISGVDPWRLHPSDVIGRVTRVWRGVGWIVRATPVLVVGAVATWGLCLLARRRSTVSLAVLGGSLTLAAAVVVYQPITAAEQLAFTPTATGAEATYVSTGLLPVRLSGDGGEHVDLGSGEVGSVSGRAEGADGRVAVSVQPHLPAWFWIALVLGSFVPALGTLVTGVEDRSGRRAAGTPAPAGRPRGHHRPSHAARSA